MGISYQHIKDEIDRNGVIKINTPKGVRGGSIVDDDVDFEASDPHLVFEQDNVRFTIDTESIQQLTVGNPHE